MLVIPANHNCPLIKVDWLHDDSSSKTKIHLARQSLLENKVAEDTIFSDITEPNFEFYELILEEIVKKMNVMLNAIQTKFLNVCVCTCAPPVRSEEPGLLLLGGGLATFQLHHSSFPSAAGLVKEWYRFL